MCVKYFEGSLSGQVDATQWQAGLDLPALVDDLRNLVGTFQYNVALQKIWLEVLDAANRYVQVKEPFKLIKTDPEACKVVLINLAEALRVIAILIKPFLPSNAETFYRAFNFEEAKPWDSVQYQDAALPSLLVDLRVTAPLVGGKPTPLFPKIEQGA